MLNKKELQKAKDAWFKWLEKTKQTMGQKDLRTSQVSFIAGWEWALNPESEEEAITEEPKKKTRKKKEDSESIMVDF